MLPRGLPTLVLRAATHPVKVQNCNLNSTYRNEAVKEWERSTIMNERRGTTVNHNDYNFALIRFLHEIL